MPEERILDWLTPANDHGRRAQCSAAFFPTQWHFRLAVSGIAGVPDLETRPSPPHSTETTMSIAKKSMIALAAVVLTAALSTPSFSVPVEISKPPVHNDTGFCVLKDPPFCLPF
jgi:hypothetical protein